MDHKWRRSALAAVLLTAALVLCALPLAGAEGAEAPEAAPAVEAGEPLGGLRPVPELVCLPDVRELPAGAFSTVAPDFPGAEEAILQGALEYETVVELSYYHIMESDLGDLYHKLLNRYGRLFHVENGSYSKYNNGMVVSLTFNYNMTQRQYTAARAFYDAELQRILDQIPAGFSDLEKVLFLHEYIATHYRYDTEGLAAGSAIYDAYQMLREGKGVCQAYTLMVEDLLDELHIPVSYCQSRFLNHIWNLVELDGRWYHLDVTHDDPSYSISGLSLGQDMLGGAVHKYFLITDETCKTNRKNSGGDWVYGVNATCTDARYETSVFADADSPFAYDPDTGTWYYMDMTQAATRGLYRWDKSGGITASTKLNADVGNSYNYNLALCWFDGQLYYNTLGNICRWDPAAKTTATVLSAPGTAYYLGMSIREGKLFYQLLTDAVVVEYGRFALERSGAGTQASPYLISDQAELEAFRDLVNTGSFTLCGRLTEDIVYTGTWNSMATMTGYRGTFDGDGHVIATLSSPLLGTNAGTVERLGVFGTGICATNSGTVRNCLAYGNASAPLVRTNNAAGRVEHCCANGAGKLCATNNGTVTNSYYTGPAGEPGTGLPTASFTSGEVTWRLQKGQGDGAGLVWSQKLTGSVQQYPTLDAEEAGRVCKVTFATGENAAYAAAYCNVGDTVALPAAPVSDSFLFTRWATAADGTGSFSAASKVTGDITVYAVGQEKYGPTDADTAITLTYDPASAQSVDLTGYAAYAAGSTGSFQYALKSQTGGLDAAVSAAGTLTVPAATAAGRYTVTVTVREAAPVYRPFAVTGAGVQPFELDLTLTVQPRTVTAVVAVAEGEYVYTCGAITPAVTVKDGERVIPAGEYTVDYEDNVDAGAAAVIISNVEGGNYVVSGSAAFTIQPKPVTAAVTVSEGPWFYTGDAITPAVTVKDGERVIPAGEYTVGYEDNVDAGAAAVIISNVEGGNYVVSGSAAFTILPPVSLEASRLDVSAGKITVPLVCAPDLAEGAALGVAALYDSAGGFLTAWALSEVRLTTGTLTFTGTLPANAASCRVFLMDQEGLMPLVQPA